MNITICQPEDVWHLRKLTAAILCVCFVIGLVGNGLVLWMTVFRMTRTVTTIWFFNLALSDFIVLLSLPIAIHTLTIGEWPFNQWVCKLYQGFRSLIFFTSINLLVLISVDRCISVLYPIWARNHRTVQRANWLAVGVWLLSAFTCYPYLKFRSIGTLKNCSYCYVNFNTTHGEIPILDQVVVGRHMAMTIAHLLLGFLVPLVVIGTCAHLIWTNIRWEGRVHTSWTKRLLLVLVSVFFTCWFPFNVALWVQLWRFVQYRNPIDPKMLIFLWATSSLGCLNSCLNPFLYVFIGRDFKQKFLQSIPSSLARAFAEDGVLSLTVPKVKPQGNNGDLQVQAGSPSAVSQGISLG
ncbi:PREDICTED: probable G-protein coupled receptor 32-like [Chrysochloris asiatica]|uniref:Probable G-protein coupled receptor 32-like n=1 Tax=Chrysochloris asiatica TaxID=185453 RepID=A0A9B0WV70_CHRAS|nr:PREDICTED: probable G-protein coupled receptor 32-like [Chrysochloris asiatica]